MNKEGYKILKNSQFGRYMVASRTIKSGELILTEKPILLGQQIDGPLVCFNCCRSVINSGYIFCLNCNVAVYCSPKCTGYLHNSEECSALRNAKIDKKALAENSQIILPVRCLLLKHCNPEIWNRVLELEPHLETRRDTPIWRRHKFTVEQILSEMKFISEDDLKQELVQIVCGILDVNTFEVRPPQVNNMVISNPEVQCIRGLYLNAALMAHDCIANTHLSVDDEFVLTVHASVDIPENAPIFFNYSNVLQGTNDRRRHLREGKYFECRCERCNDPTELGTEFSSLRCHKCKKGTIRSTDPATDNSDWACSECKHVFKSEMINLIVEEGRRRIQETDHVDIVKMEKLLETLLQTFHPNHYLIIELQQNIIALYARLPRNRKNLSRKVELCYKILEVFEKIEPGLSRLKAIALYELQSTLIDLAHKEFRDKRITDDDFILKLLSGESTLKEAIKHLLYEPSKSPEGKIAQLALSELKMLRMSIKSIQDDLFQNQNDTGLKIKQNVSIKGINNEQEKGNVEVTETKQNGKKKRNRRKKNI